MSQIPEHKRGMQDAFRVAITWLHERANSMNDPHARSVLHSAATNMGWEFTSRAQHQNSLPEPPTNCVYWVSNEAVVVYDCDLPTPPHTGKE